MDLRRLLAPSVGGDFPMCKPKLPTRFRETLFSSLSSSYRFHPIRPPNLCPILAIERLAH